MWQDNEWKGNNKRTRQIQVFSQEDKYSRKGKNNKQTIHTRSQNLSYSKGGGGEWGQEERLVASQKRRLERGTIDYK